MAERWTLEEDTLLKEIYENSSKKEISTKIEKPWLSIRRRALRLALHRNPELVDIDRCIKGPRSDSWTPKEEALLKSIYEQNTKEVILSKFSRTWQSIFTRAKLLGLKRDSEIVKKEMISGGSSVEKEDKWTEEEDLSLLSLYANTPRSEMLIKFRRTWSAIRGRAAKLKIKRDPELVKKETLENTHRAVKEKYGVDYSTQLESMKEKSRATNIARRGVAYPTQSEEVRDKIKDTVNKLYGVDNVFQSEEIKDKLKSTNIEKYGVESPLQNKDIFNKAAETTFERYGVDNPFKLLDRVKEGMMEKYGETTPARVPEIIQKKKDTNLDRYGFEYPQQNKDIKEKIESTNLDRYGFKTPLLNPDIIKKIYEKAKELGFSISQEELDFFQCLKKLDKRTKHQVLHPVLNHVIDFYVPKYDMWVQYDGIYWHGKVLPDPSTRHYQSIIRAMKNDEYQNKNIPNLVRFWSDEVTKCIKDKKIDMYIKDKVLNKVNDVKMIVKNNTCHQYLKKIEHVENDKKTIQFDISNLKVIDFDFSVTEIVSDEIVKFIEKYEWLGTIGVNPKWCFTARYKGTLGGVVLINEPTAYSKLLGQDTQKYEALVQRGATASWTPKNLGSRLIMLSCRWMAQNTKKRLFTGYADPKAHEMGTIYQACNFEYLGDTFGSTYMYRHPKIKDGKEFSAQSLKRTSAFRRWCKENNVIMQKNWFNASGFKNLSIIPTEIKNMWYSWINTILQESEKIPVEKKHKYVLLLGKDRREERSLKTLKNYNTYPYPKRAL